MAAITVRPITFAAKPPTHLGTSDGKPHSYNEILVEPSSVAVPKVTDPLYPVTKGGDFYAKLYEIDDGAPASAARGPRYFGVGFRFGITDISTVNIFCHPNPGHAGMSDSNYVGLNGEWSNLYRYVQYFGVQLAAGTTNMVIVMPMLSNATWLSLGILRSGWQDILNSILVEVQKVAWPDGPGETMIRNQTAMQNVILSDFSAGRSAMNVARSLPGMDKFLREIWDFDGAGGVPPNPPSGGRSLIYDQAGGGGGVYTFHVPLSRWARFPFYVHDKLQPLGIHGEIPQRLFYHASAVSAFGH